MRHDVFRPSTPTTAPLSTMGWHTADKVRNEVSCPMCGANAGDVCANSRSKNHNERVIKYRRQRSLLMRKAQGR